MDDDATIDEQIGKANEEVDRHTGDAQLDADNAAMDVENAAIDDEEQHVAEEIATGAPVEDPTGRTGPVPAAEGNPPE